MAAPSTGALLVAALLLAFPARSARADDDPDTEIARRHFASGSTLYEAHDYAKALVEFRAAREMRPVPELDFNIGRCLDRMERFDEAIAEYQKYVEARPADAADVRTRIEQLRARLAARAPVVVKPAPAAPPTEPLPAAPPPIAAVDGGGGGSPIVPVIVGIAALAAAATGTALVLTVGPELDTLKMSGCDAPCAALEGLKGRAYAGYALWGVAGAAAVVDIVLWVVQRRRPSRAAARLIPTAGGFALTGAF